MPTPLRLLAIMLLAVPLTGCALADEDIGWTQEKILARGWTTPKRPGPWIVPPPPARCFRTLGDVECVPLAAGITPLPVVPVEPAMPRVRPAAPQLPPVPLHPEL